MKKTISFLLFGFLALQLNAQTSGRIEGLRDAWGTSFDYIGAIKDNKPNGLGVAIYSNNSALKYAGYFVNGQFSGKGVLQFESGNFLSGTWKNGLLDGQGTDLMSSGNLYVGNFSGGKRNGSGILLYADKSILEGSFKDDAFDGRCIYIDSVSNTISDNIYVNGVKNGSGYQYEVDSKTLYEGNWTDGKWTGSGTASFNSFLKSQNMYGEKTSNQIIMGLIDRNNNSLMQDTGFFNNLETGYHYFGKYDKGYLADGVTLGDSSRFIGKKNEDGAYGYCSVYKTGKNYFEGNYVKDYLQGKNCLVIGVAKPTIYYGDIDDQGGYTGKGWYANSNNDLYSGDFNDGSFTGNGYFVFKNGKTIKGSFKNGIPVNIVSFTDENGNAISLKPKTFSEALSIVVNEYSNDYNAFKLDYADSVEYSLDDYMDTYESFITFPKAIEQDVILYTWDNELMYHVNFYKGTSYTDAAAKYNELCKQIAGASLNLSRSKTPVTLTGNIIAPSENESTHSSFGLNNYSTISDDFKVSAELEYISDTGEYKVNLIAGDVNLED
ncbi:MAG: hypothetical protein JST21_12175 [Bacteroidetes bacterium]|nr:hypothetical protein [Bacteroidota bacterium]